MTPIRMLKVVALATAAPVALSSIGIVTASANEAGFTIADGARALPIYVDAGDAELVRIAAQMTATDIGNVVGVNPVVNPGPIAGDRAILAGTVQGSDQIKDLAARGKIDLSGLKEVWEGYKILRVANPWPNVREALVVVGSDKRGAAYGILSLSRSAGVSPWTWWSDIKPARRQSVEVEPTSTVVSPSVQYRGIFINDEDWSLRPWAEETFEPETGNIGPKTYQKVFELMLRLRSNVLWPAMHPGSMAFNQDPRNADLADRYGIVMGASHAEPMLRNNVAEWDAGRWGDFNFETNAKAVTRYWDDRVASNAKFENLYTVGMRGIHDTPVVAGSKVDRVKLLEHIVDVQRDLLTSHGADPAKVPQIFVPYKEVLETYRKGMTLPDDITLGWVDDNFGYIRQLSTPEEQKRSGGGGVYYHISYWGWPTSYLWLATTPPALIASEMGRAWQTNSKRAWILNVGDIKPGEIGAEYFLDLAWNYGEVSKLQQRDYLDRWAANTFGKDSAGEIAGILDEYYRLTFIRKPEHMNFSHDDVGVQPGDFSPVSYGDEASRYLADFAQLRAQAEKLGEKVPAEQQDAYFELVLYPVLGANWTAVKALNADRSYLAAWQGRASANAFAQKSAEAQREIKDATRRYNRIGDGKWKHYMNDDPRDQASFAGFPTGRVVPATTPGLGLALEGSVDALVNSPAKALANYERQVARWRSRGEQKDVLPAIDRATRSGRFIDLFNTGDGSIDYRITSDADWVSVSEPEGSFASEKRIWLTADWTKAPKAGGTASITVISGHDSYVVKLPVSAALADVRPGDFVESSGVVSIEAENFSRKIDAGRSGWKVKPQLGRSGGAIEADAGVNSVDTVAQAPSVEYRFTSQSTGDVGLTVVSLPTFALDRDRKLRYAVSIDNRAPQIVEIDPEQKWDLNVTRNARYSTTKWAVQTSGRHSIRLWALDPALVVDRLVVDFGGERQSYMGPPETRAAR